MHYDLGYIDLEQGTLQTIDNPFGTRLSPMSQVQTVTHVSGPYKEKAGRSGRIRTCDPLIPNQVRYQAALHSEAVTLHCLEISARERNPRNRARSQDGRAEAVPRPMAAGLKPRPI